MIKKILVIVFILISFKSLSQIPLHKDDFTHDEKYFYTYEVDKPPYDTRDSYLATLLFILEQDDQLTDNTRAKLYKEIGYVYYIKHKHESADYYFFKSKEFFEMPKLTTTKKGVVVNDEPKQNKTETKPNTEQKFLEKLFSLKYQNLSKEQIEKLSKDVDNQINKLTAERDSIILSDDPDKEKIKEKQNSLNVLKNTKHHLKSVLQNIQLKFEKGQLKKYLYWALIGLGLLILVIVLIIWNVRQKLKISKQDDEIEKQLVDINTKNTYLEHAARIIRHDMHSGINTYIPRGLSSLERRLSESDIQNLKLEGPLKLIKDGVSHAQKVYKNVYAFTNLVKKDVVLEKSVCDLKEILENYLENTSYKSDVIVNDLTTIEVDETLFCTAVDNLIRNGLKYNDSNNKVVQIFMEDSETIVIQDNGRGMTKKEFESHLKPHESNGLGLNICVAILKEHGFSVDCEKNETGTKIKIKIKNNK